MSVNKVILVGRLGADPEVRNSQSGLAIAKISLATTERVKDKDGNWNESTEWHRITAFGKTAETAGQYLVKGRQIYIEGRLKTTKYTDKNGVEKYSTEVVCERMQFLGSKSDGAGSSGGQSNGYGGGSSSGGSSSGGGYGGGRTTGRAPLPAPPEDDDIPF
jgi:single-strand DNA-binding protein